MNNPNPQGLPIYTLETWTGTIKAFDGNVPTKNIVQQVCVYLCKQGNLPLPPADWKIIDTSHVALADINHGRWIARCPCCTGGAMYISKVDRTFWCMNCRNACSDYHPIRVVFPPDASERERIMLARPDPTTRSCLYNETIEDLAKENRLRGLPESI